MCGLLGFAWCFLVVSLWVILMMSKSTRLGWFDSFGILSRRIFTCLMDSVAWFWLPGNNSFKLDGDGMEASVFRFRYNESLGLSFADSVWLLNNWILNRCSMVQVTRKLCIPWKRNIHQYVFELVRPRISCRNRGSMLPFPYRGKNQLNIGYQIWWQEAERSMVVYQQSSLSIDLYIHCFCIAYELESCSQSFFLDLFTLPVSQKTNTYMHYLLSIRVTTSPKVVESVWHLDNRTRASLS